MTNVIFTAFNVGFCLPLCRVVGLYCIIFLCILTERGAFWCHMSFFNTTIKRIPLLSFHFFVLSKTPLMKKKKKKGDQVIHQVLSVKRFGCQFSKLSKIRLKFTIISVEQTKIGLG